MLNIYDNVLSKQENNDLLHRFLYDTKYRYGERDRPELDPVGISSEIDNYNLHQYLIGKVESVCDDIKGLKHKRSYINLFSPNERPFFHRDGEVITCLFYIVPESIDQNIDEGGETQFIIKNKLQGVFPKLGRLVTFDGTIRHRATSFRTHPRLTVALKFSK